MSAEFTIGPTDPDERLEKAEMALRQRELLVRERELTQRETSLERERSEKGKAWGAPLTLAIAGATLALVSNVVMEGYRSYQACFADARRGFISAAGDYTGQLARASQALTFLLWTAKYAPQTFTKADFEVYEKDVKSLRPALLTALISVAGHDRASYERLRALAEASFYTADAAVGRLEPLHEKAPEEAIKNLGLLWPQSDVYELMANQVSSVLDGANDVAAGRCGVWKK